MLQNAEIIYVSIYDYNVLDADGKNSDAKSSKYSILNTVLKANAVLITFVLVQYLQKFTVKMHIYLYKNWNVNKLFLTHVYNIFLH